jgi:hypothetical protein
VIPVRAVISNGIGPYGSWNDEKTSLGPATRPVWQVVELDHSEFYDFVVLLIEAGRFHLDQDTGLRLLADRWSKSLAPHQAPKERGNRQIWPKASAMAARVRSFSSIGVFVIPSDTLRTYY